jgi:hypothetical protein
MVWLVILHSELVWIRLREEQKYTGLVVRVMVFNATFNNISAILWQSVLLVEETGVPRENHWPAASLIQHYVIKFVSDLQQVGGFLRVLQFPPPKNWLPRYNWNIVESGIKHRNPNPVFLNWCYSITMVLVWIRLREEQKYRVRVTVFNATFNNISVISWQSVFWWRKLENPEKTTNLL